MSLKCSHIIPGNASQIPNHVLTLRNNSSNNICTMRCKEMREDPASSFPSQRPDFFIKPLTEEADLVVGLFAGLNTVAAVSEQRGRH